MDRCILVLLGALRRFSLASPSWPHSDALARAQEGAAELDRILSEVVSPDLLRVPGRRGRVLTMQQLRRKLEYQQKTCKDENTDR